MTEKKTFSWKNFAIKGIILFVYGLLLALFLYFPRISSVLFERKQMLHVYAFREVIEKEALVSFEQKTGISVRVTYYETNEEMFAKFKINKGEGYDLVFPSDYMVELMHKEKMLQEIDHAKISNVTKLDSRLMHRYFDPDNRYSLPICWIPYGIGFNKQMIKLPDDVSWDVAFKKATVKALGDYRISMLNDARDALFLSAVYLFGTVQNLGNEKIEKIKELLIKQKEFVECYTEGGAKYLLASDIVPMAVIPSVRVTELINEDEHKYGFLIPREGSIVDVINIGIPAASKKAELAHKLIDFLLSEDVSLFHFKKFSCNPANKNVYAMINKKYREKKSFFPDDTMFKHLYILHNQVSTTQLEKMWFFVKSA